MSGVSTSRTRAALADDDVLLREGLASLLQGAGFEVIGKCGDAAELIALVREHRPDLVIVDIRMPPDHGTEGLEAARVIREEAPETAILVLSAHVEVEHAMDILGGGQPTLTGPFIVDKSNIDVVGKFAEAELRELVTLSPVAGFLSKSELSADRIRDFVNGR